MSFGVVYMEHMAQEDGIWNIHNKDEMEARKLTFPTKIKDANEKFP